ncbi:carbohydrate ABC transporter permease [Cohnella abietis]|uniref:Maltose ABC transporter permease n=1 Tax=Cohnella abietis TaxID=2507935 RepID=A0A3T1CYD0_9BACL|nr:carbohydrate ABC transporter permease [Cohnella abietis]BBI30850.1 maltose ABC transporter permease [Cohnella abietis]
MNTSFYKAPWSERLLTIFNYLIILFVCLTIILPLLNIFALAFNSGADAQRGGIYIWPREWTFENFTEVFAQSQMTNGFIISLIRTVAGTISSVFLTAMAAYALTSRTLPGRGVIAFFIFFTMLFSGGMIPYYLVLKELHLTNTIWVYIVPSLYNVWNIMVMRTFFQQVPEGLEEAARMDGLNDFGIFFRIILPLSKPVIATMSLFNAVTHWNDWFTGTFFVRNPDIKPASTLLQEMLTTQKALSNALMKSSGSLSYEMVDRIQITGDSLKMATILLVVLPVILIFPFVQKHFTKGVSAGALKE